MCECKEDTSLGSRWTKLRVQLRPETGTPSSHYPGRKGLRSQRWTSTGRKSYLLRLIGPGAMVKSMAECRMNSCCLGGGYGEVLKHIDDRGSRLSSQGHVHKSLWVGFHIA